MSYQTHANSSFGSKPAVAVKPKHLVRKNPPAPLNADQLFCAKAGLQHMTPKVWSQPKSTNLASPVGLKPSAPDHHVTSPFSKGQWRSVPQVQPKPLAKKKPVPGVSGAHLEKDISGADQVRDVNTNKQLNQSLEAAKVRLSLPDKKEGVLHEKSKYVDGMLFKDYSKRTGGEEIDHETSSKAMDHPPKVLLKPRLSGTRPRTNIQHRYACLLGIRFVSFQTFCVVAHKILFL